MRSTRFTTTPCSLHRGTLKLLPSDCSPFQDDCLSLKDCKVQHYDKEFQGPFSDIVGFSVKVSKPKCHFSASCGLDACKFIPSGTDLRGLFLVLEDSVEQTTAHLSEEIMFGMLCPAEPMRFREFESKILELGWRTCNHKPCSGLEVIEDHLSLSNDVLADKNMATVFSSIVFWLQHENDQLIPHILIRRILNLIYVEKLTFEQLLNHRRYCRMLMVIFSVMEPVLPAKHAENVNHLVFEIADRHNWDFMGIWNDAPPLKAERLYVLPKEIPDEILDDFLTSCTEAARTKFKDKNIQSRDIDLHLGNIKCISFHSKGRVGEEPFLQFKIRNEEFSLQVCCDDLKVDLVDRSDEYFTEQKHLDDVIVEQVYHCQWKNADSKTPEWLFLKSGSLSLGSVSMCKGSNKSGPACKNKTKHLSGKCWRHRSVFDLM
jgi:hypothetical protein